MKKATISQTKNHLSALLDLVRGGESVLIVDRDTPVARIEPVAGRDPSGRLRRLERAGVLRRGPGRGDPALLREEPPRARGGADVLEALLAERAAAR